MAAFFAACAAFGLSGCLTSVEPFYSDESLLRDDRIVGDYRAEAGGDGFVIERGDFDYRVTYFEGPAWIEFSGNLFQHGEDRFLDLQPDSDSGDYRVAAAPPTGIQMLRALLYKRLHLLLRVELSDEGFAFSFVPPDRIRDAIGIRPELEDFRRGNSLLLKIDPARLPPLLDSFARHGIWGEPSFHPRR